MPETLAPTPEQDIPSHPGQWENPSLREVQEDKRYDDLHPSMLTSGERLSPEEIMHRMETDHVVKVAPRLPDQLNDPARTNTIISIPASQSLGSGASNEEYVPNRVAYSAAEVLSATNIFLKTAMACEAELGPEVTAKARSLYENATVIDDKEYQEAAAGLATYWKILLESNPHQQILAYGGELGNLGPYRERIVKSDAYLLDTILSHFSDEEVEKYKGRLIVDVADVTAKDADNLKVILLDDWTIGGTQLLNLAAKFQEKYPQFASSVEIQLVTANTERIEHGLTDPADDTRPAIPVKAYFKAHDAPTASGISRTGAHITGAHSSVDTDFELTLATITSRARNTPTLSDEQHAILDHLPPMANIVRPYRLSGVELTQRKRFELQGDKASSDVADQQYADVW